MGDALAHIDAQIAITGRLARGHCVVEILLFFVNDQEGPGFRLKELLHLLHDGAQDRIQVERRCECTRYVVEDPEVLGQGRTRWKGIIDHF
jgi:hypothetical protein